MIKYQIFLGNVLDNSSDEDAPCKKKEITKGYKKDDFLSGFKGGFLSKKKKNSKKHKKNKKNKNEENKSTEQSVEEWLLSSGLSATTCSNLISNGYDSMSLFLVCTEGDIDAICKEFNLSTAERMKLKAAINGLIDIQTKRERRPFKKGDHVMYEQRQYEVVSAFPDKICLKTVVSKSEFDKISHVQNDDL